MKKRLLFANYAMVCGGVEKSLLAVLALLPPKKYEVTLFLKDIKGALLDQVPSWVKIVEIPFAKMDRYELEHGRVSTLKYSLAHFHWLHAFGMLWLRMKWVLGGRRQNFDDMSYRAMAKRIDRNKLPQGFDHAFTYGGGMLLGNMVAECIDAKSKAIWCHNENEVGNILSGKLYGLYAKFDHRFATGDMSRKLGFEMIPYCLDPEMFRRMASDGRGFTDDFNGIRILTVGRLGHQKGIDEAIKIAARLKTDGLNFRWYVVGDGEDRAKLEAQIKELDVEDCFTLLGLHVNPYPFFAQCDIYAQPSRWEAYCITVAEARAFAKPIVCTDFVGAREQLVDGETGSIVALNDWDGFYRSLKQLIKDESLRDKFSANLHSAADDELTEVKKCWASVLNDNQLADIHKAV